MTGVLAIAAALFCLVGAGMCAAAEAALARVSKREAARWVEQEIRGAASVQAAVLDPAPVVNVAVFLRLLLEALAVAMVASWATTVSHSALVGVTATALVMGVIIFAVGGVSPRTVGRAYPQKVAPLLVPGLRAITRLLGPIARLLVKITNAVTPGGGTREGPFASELELRNMVDVASETQVIDAGERRMVQAIFELGETLVRGVMVPRTDLVTVDSGTRLDRAMRLFIRSGFSRIPVIGEGRDDVLGIVYFKDVARHIYDAGPSGSDVAHRYIVDDVMRPAHFVPDSLTVERMMEKMQSRQSHVAIAVDEYGGVAGLATMEDLVEEIVGEIADEHDRVHEDVEEVSEGVFRVRSRLSIGDLGDLFGTDIDDDDVDTVGGLLAKAVGLVPIAGSEATIHGVHIVADRFEGRRKRLATVLVSRDPHTPKSAPDQEN